MTRPLLAEYAQNGWALVWFAVGEKGPVWKGWNQKDKCVTDPEVAELLDGNIGLAHAYSGTCCVDLDDLQTARAWLAERGIDVDALIGDPGAVMISSGRGNRAKLLYSTIVPLPSFRLPGFELRCASSTGKTVQDVLPPSIHPVTQKPYEWKYGSEFAHWSMPPELPAEVRKLWESLITPETKIAREKPEGKPLPKGKLAALLKKHDPDGDYNAWVQVGMALHHEFKGGDAGLDLWDQWSAAGTKYKGRGDLEQHWRSFRHDAANPKTVASLRVEEPATADEFEIVTAEEIAAFPVVPAAMPVTVAAKEVYDKLQRDKSGHVLNTLPNVLPVLGCPEITGTSLSYDSFKDLMLVAKAGTDEWRPLRDTDYTAFRVWLENDANFWPCGKDLVRDAVHYLAEANKMDSAQIWLSSLIWDGVPRIEKFFPEYMGTVDTRYEREVGLYLWTALAGRVMEPGCQVDMCPILVGRQGLGKSQGVRALVPDPEFYCEIRLDEQDDAIARKMRGTLVGELAELRGLRTGDLDRIKAFVTRTHEKWTPKYVEFATTFARRLVMIGTTNEDEFLADEENRRWLPVRTAGVDVDAIVRDRDQLWAEALQVWFEHGIRWRDAEKLARLHQSEYRVTDQWEPLIEQWLQDNPVTQVRLHDILVQAVGLDVRTVTRQHELRGAKILRHFGFVNKPLRENGRLQKVWIKVEQPTSTA